MPVGFIDADHRSGYFPRRRELLSLFWDGATLPGEGAWDKSHFITDLHSSTFLSLSAALVQATEIA